MRSRMYNVQMYNNLITDGIAEAANYNKTTLCKVPCDAGYSCLVVLRYAPVLRFHASIAQGAITAYGKG